MSDNDFYTEEEVTFKIEETPTEETNTNVNNEEQFYDTNENENKHDQETGSFMAGVENNEPEPEAHPTTHDEEVGTFVATENMNTSVPVPEVISIETNDENDKYFNWKPKCIDDYSCYCTTQNKVITGVATLCLTGYILYRFLRR